MVCFIGALQTLHELEEMLFKAHCYGVRIVPITKHCCILKLIKTHCKKGGDAFVFHFVAMHL